MKIAEGAFVQHFTNNGCFFKAVCVVIIFNADLKGRGEGGGGWQWEGGSGRVYSVFE